MTTVVEFTVAPGAFALPEFGSDPENYAELVPLSVVDGPLGPLVRTNVSGPDAAVSALESDLTVASAQAVSTLDGGVLCRVEWAELGPLVGYLSEGSTASIETAILSEGRWTLRVWFPVRDDVSEVLAFDPDGGTSAGGGLDPDAAVDVEVERVYTAADLERSPFDLSDAQYEAVQLALHTGYYDIPRDATTADLAARAGVSQQAVSERLRRAHGRLARSAISDTRTDDER